MRKRRKEAPGAAIYVRVSTEDQASNGVSLAMQEDRLRAYCKARGWTVAGTYHDEGFSAKTTERPALRRLLQDARAGKFAAVAVYKLDRLTRRVHDLGTLIGLFEKRGISLVSLSESLDASTAAGRLMLNVLGSVAQWEREAISERIRDAIRHKRSRLEAYGPPPFGFSRTEDGCLEPLEAEMRRGRRIHDLRRKGTPLRTIAAKLNGDGVPTKRGCMWHVSTLQYLLKNDLYAPYLQDGRRK